MKIAWWIVVSAVLAGCGGFDGVPVGAEAAPTPAATGSACSHEASWSSLIASGSAGEATPDAALTRFLDTMAKDVFFEPPDATPVLIARTETGGSYEWRDEDGRSVAAVGLFSEGSGWHVNSGWSCY